MAERRMRILIIRLSAIGDIFFCTALLDALKRRYPGCEVTWLTEPMGARILTQHPQLDYLLTLPRAEWTRLWKHRQWLSLWSQVSEFIADFRRPQYDLVIDPQGILKSAIWAKLARAEQRVGVNGKDGSAVLYDALVKVVPESLPPLLNEYRKLVRGLGGDPETIAMRLPIAEAARAAVTEWLGESASPIVFCPFTTRPQKHWPDTHWSALGDLLAEATGAPIVILGGPEDGPRAQAIASGMRFTPRISAGTDRSIAFALATLERAIGVIGVDTGLTHAGIALHRPTIALFGSTRPYARTGLAHARVLFKDLPCAPCRRHPTCAGRFDCMQQLVPEEVKRSFLELLNSTPSARLTSPASHAGV